MILRWLRDRLLPRPYGDGSRYDFLRRVLILRDDDTPYLLRWILFKTPLLATYLHHFLASDDDCLHDHPASFLSIILCGGYWEIDRTGKKKWYGRFSILYRPAAWSHRIEIHPDIPTWTLVFRGPVVRRWGFWTKAGEWIHWKEYSKKEHCGV